MKSSIWILSLCLWLPQAWAQKVQIFDAPGSNSTTQPQQPTQLKVEPGQTVQHVAPAEVGSPPKRILRPSDVFNEDEDSEMTEQVVAAPEYVKVETPEAEVPTPEQTQQQKDLAEILAALHGGKTMTDVIRDPVLSKKLVNAYQDNPLKDVPESIVRGSIAGQLSKTQIGSWVLANIPSAQNFLVEFVRDPVALGTMLRILNHTDDLMFYANVSIVLFFVMYFVRRQVVFTMESRFKRIIVRLCFTFIFWFGAYWAYSAKFGEYLTPTWEIFAKHFF